MSLHHSLAKKLTNYHDPKSFASRLRAKRIAPLLRIIEIISKEHNSVKVIDIGGRKEYWNIVPQDFFERHNIQITIINLSEEELPENQGAFTFIHADGCNLAQFDDNLFHIAHSNSVIEHVGDWSRMVLFSEEVKRVAQHYFVQTPNY